MGKKTPNLNLPIISSDDYQTTKVVDMIDDIQGDKNTSAFNIIDAAVAAKQDKITVNPVESTELKCSKIKIDGVVYKVSGDIDQIDTVISSTSTNPVQNKVIYTALQGKTSASDVQTMINDAITGLLNQGF